MGSASSSSGLPHRLLRLCKSAYKPARGQWIVLQQGPDDYKVVELQ
jgi:hypothetical protein